MTIAVPPARRPKFCRMSRRLYRKIDNWSVCDSFCASLTIARRHPVPVWTFLKPYFGDCRPYFRRFGVVMLLDHYVTETYF